MTRAEAVKIAHADFTGKLEECAADIRAVQKSMAAESGPYAGMAGGTVDMGPVGPQSRDAAFEWAKDGVRDAAMSAGASYAEACEIAFLTFKEIETGVSLY